MCITSVHIFIALWSLVWYEMKSKSTLTFDTLLLTFIPKLFYRGHGNLNYKLTWQYLEPHPK